MAEPEKERDTEIDDGLEECVEEEEKEEFVHSQLPNTSLVDLNMLLVLLSSAYCSKDDECIEEYDEDSKYNMVRDQQVALDKTCISSSRIHTKRHEPKLGRRSFTPRCQTTIRDTRHGRKM